MAGELSKTFGPNKVIREVDSREKGRAETKTTKFHFVGDADFSLAEKLEVSS